MSGVAGRRPGPGLVSGLARREVVDALPSPVGAPHVLARRRPPVAASLAPRRRGSRAREAARPRRRPRRRWKSLRQGLAVRGDLLPPHRREGPRGLVREHLRQPRRRGWASSERTTRARSRGVRSAGASRSPASERDAYGSRSTRRTRRRSTSSTRRQDLQVDQRRAVVRVRRAAARRRSRSTAARAARGSRASRSTRRTRSGCSPGRSTKGYHGGLFESKDAGKTLDADRGHRRRAPNLHESGLGQRRVADLARQEQRQVPARRRDGRARRGSRDDRGVDTSS